MLSTFRTFSTISRISLSPAASTKLLNKTTAQAEGKSKNRKKKTFYIQFRLTFFKTLSKKL